MMSHPDPKTHLLQRGWTVLPDDDDNPSAWCWRLAGEVGFRVTLCAGQFSMNAHACELDASDVYALSLLAEQTRKLDATTSTVADKSLVDLTADEQRLWTETVRQLLGGGFAMKYAIEDADTFIVALRKRGA